MYQLNYRKTKNGYVWEVVYKRGKTNTVLAKSGQAYRAIHHAKRAFYRLMEIFPEITEG